MNAHATLPAEQWLAKRLVQHSALADPAGIFAGDTTPEQRRQFFERVFGEPLDVPRGTNTPPEANPA